MPHRGRERERERERKSIRSRSHWLKPFWLKILAAVDPWREFIEIAEFFVPELKDGDSHLERMGFPTTTQAADLHGVQWALILLDLGGQDQCRTLEV